MEYVIQDISSGKFILDLPEIFPTDHKALGPLYVARRFYNRANAGRMAERLNRETPAGLQKFFVVRFSHRRSTPRKTSK